MLSKLDIWVVEDNFTIREGIKSLLLHHFNEVDVKTFSNGESALDMVDQSPCPDLILLDLGLPQISGLDTLVILKQKWKHAKILVFTIFNDNENLFDALKLGACGYILKSDSFEILTKSIDEALSGGAPMSREIAIKVLRSFSTVNQNELQVLTQREMAVLVLLSRGLLYKEIADKLAVSQNTIKNHLQNIYLKLHVTNRSEAIAEYFKNKK